MWDRNWKWEICVQGQHLVLGKKRLYLGYWQPTGNIFGSVRVTYILSQLLCSSLCITLYLQPNLLFVSSAWLNLHMVVGWPSKVLRITEKPFLFSPSGEELNLEFTCTLWSIGIENSASTRLEIVARLWRNQTSIARWVTIPCSL